MKKLELMRYKVEFVDPVTKEVVVVDFHWSIDKDRDELIKELDKEIENKEIISYEEKPNIHIPEIFCEMLKGGCVYLRD